ncbi:MAG TPA: cupredoxin domain-containing protein, partial [Candidatus Limnocylindrales bacterium]|nr:cupredoxin domain-containing protein [Candidatus Limnocylindrales bacterium]
LVVVAALSAACASAAPTPSVSGPVDPNGPTIVAKDMKFQGGEVDVKAGENLTLHFQNQDSAPHNVAIYKDSSASSPISVGQIVTSTTADQVIPALAAGTYFFRCDVHHDMTGTIVAK